ncbi:PID-CTERM protein-sorting domain-containing protein [Peijinzhouia sedimentorum]
MGGKENLPLIYSKHKATEESMKYILLTSLLFLSAVSYAQTFGGPPSFTPDVLDNPIDGGLSLLLGAGAAYGAKKLRDRRRRSEKRNDKA